MRILGFPIEVEVFLGNLQHSLPTRKSQSKSATREEAVNAD
jgi:hypothetical protein